MSSIVLQEEFHGSTVDARLKWMNEPTNHKISHNDGEDKTQHSLTVYTNANTDFWQKTHYGFRVDNGHLLYAEVEGDFIATTRMRWEPRNQYDQAGLMVRIDETSWLKTSVEYEIPPETCKLGAVCTNMGYSDWSTQKFDSDHRQLVLRIRREGTDYFVEYLDNSWTPAYSRDKVLSYVTRSSTSSSSSTHQVSLSDGKHDDDASHSTVATASGAEAFHWIQMRMCHLHDDKGGPVKIGMYTCSPKEEGYKVDFDFFVIQQP
eukprot:TRINITY_DN8834_c0_g1_i1.p1 TRINITY_DN8834_c0_g1~~TRINITY_DN8834_c0_g1_i1.p1  ORF type:complete len:289 (+),score=65.21 TRINITY_DN8834_c0_g1_i1:83-868(+)